MLTRAQLIEVLRANSDEGWIEPLLADPDSAAILGAMAAVWERVSIAVDRGCDAGLISLAPPATPGVSMLRLERPSAGLAGTIPKGTRYRSVDRTEAAATMDVTVGAGVLTVLVPLETLRSTELVNTVDDPGFTAEPSRAVAGASNASPVVITTFQPSGYVEGQLVNVAGVLGNLGANGTFPIHILTATTFELTGSVGSGVFAGGGLVQPAPFDLVPTTADPIMGSTSDALGAHGRERGTIRQPGESTDAYRARIRNIPDAVSPRAIIAAVNGVAQHANLPVFDLLEPFGDGATPALKTALHLGSFESEYLDVDFFDDPFGQMLGRREAVAYFDLVATSPPRDPDDLRPFYDANTYFDDPVYGFPDIANHPRLLGGLLAIVDEADRKRAGGVQFDVLLPGFRDHVAEGASAAVIPTIVWTLTPAAGTVWLYVDGIFGHSPDPAGAGHAIFFTYDDATTGASGLYDDPDGQRITRSDLDGFGGGPEKRVTSIAGVVVSDGVHSVKLFGSVRVLEVTA